MKITKAKFIELLNNDLSWEYTALVQYTQHQGVLKGAQFGDIQKELIIHATEELQHATTLAQQIDYLGGFPTAEVKYQPKVNKDARKMLTQDLDGENDAIRRYTERIDQAEQLKLYHVSQALRAILAMEQEHAMDLESALGK